MSKIKNITVGCDPEMFLYSEISKKFISAIGKIGGSKEVPLPITKDGHFIQEDNVAVEFNIPPSATAEELVKHIQFVKEYIEETICKPKNLVLKCVPSALFTEDQLNNDKALTFGCDPDFNAWTGNTNEINRLGVDPMLRVCGGHIHVGYDNPDRNTSVELIKAMDLYLAVPAVLLDEDNLRRQLYGKAGAFRFKKFGVEHRTLSNFWINSPELISWVFNNLYQAVDFVNFGGFISNSNEIIDCINNNNKDAAMEIIEDYHIELPEIIQNETQDTVAVEENGTN